MNAAAETNEPGKARPAQHENLSAKFGGMLARPTAAPAAPAPADTGSRSAATKAEPETPVAAAPAPAPEQSKPSSAPRAEAQPKGQAARKQRATGNDAPPASAAPGADGVSSKADQAIPFNLPLRVWNRLEAYRRATGISNPNILFNAIEATYERLPELVAARTVSFGGGEGGGTRLFNRPQTAAQRADDGETKKQLIIRVNKENKQILDDLWPEVGAPNRTVMAVAALDDFLPNDD